MTDEGLKKKIERLGGAHILKCDSDLGRMRVVVNSNSWFSFLSLVKMENTLSFQKLHCLLGVRSESEFSLVAELSSPHWPEILSVRASIDPLQSAESISILWPYADWLECEISDLYGVSFERKSENYLSLPEATWSRIPLLAEKGGNA
jgi:NADH-quinone oxidoreductase subunit C